MKKSLVIALAALVVSACSSTTVVTNKPLPPGQAKKVTGSQSAAPYAPGHQKKAATKSAPPGQAKKKN
jgi:hypothetical protein